MHNALDKKNDTVLVTPNIFLADTLGFLVSLLTIIDCTKSHIAIRQRFFTADEVSQGFSAVGIVFLLFYDGRENRGPLAILNRKEIAFPDNVFSIG